MADNTALLAALTSMAKSLEGAIKILKTGDTGVTGVSFEWDTAGLENQVKLTSELKEAYDLLAQSADNVVDKYEDVQNAYKLTAEEGAALLNERLREVNRAVVEGEMTAEAAEVAIKKLREEYRETAEAAQNAANANDDLNKQTKTLIKTFTGVSAGTKSFTGALLGAENSMLSLGAAFKETFTASNIFNSVTAKIEESTAQMVMRTDAAFASFNRLTAAGGSLNQVMFDAQYSARAMGVTVEGAADATAALYTQMSNFTKLGPDAQKELIQTTAGMEALGISSDTTAGLLDVAMNSLRMSQDEAKALSDDLAKLSIGLKLPAKELAEGFRNALPTLAAYGKGAIKVFKGLAAAAKATSISTQELMSIFGDSMDTFEGSAQAAGRLNALLGGNLVNSMELLYATEDERIQIVKQAMDATGRNFDMLDKYEKKAIAAAVGITDMNTANKLFGTSSEQLDHYTNSLDAMGVSQEDVAKAQQAGISITQKLTAIMDSFAVGVMPLLNLFNGFLDRVLKLNDALSGYLIPTVSLFTAAISKAMILKKMGVTLAEAGSKFMKFLGPVGAVLGTFTGLYDIFVDGKMLSGIYDIASGLLFLLGPIGMVVGGLMQVIKLLYEFDVFGFQGAIAGTGFDELLGGGAGVQQANDLIMRPGEKPIMLNKDDIVLAGTNLLGEQAARNTGVVNNATYNTSNVSNTTQTAAPSAPMKERDLVIQINGREIGRVAADYIRKEYSLVNNSGY